MSRLNQTICVGFLLIVCVDLAKSVCISQSRPSMKAIPQHRPMPGSAPKHSAPGVRYHRQIMVSHPVGPESHVVVPSSSRRQSLEQRVQGIESAKNTEERIGLAIEAHNWGLILAEEGNLDVAEKLVQSCLAVLEKAGGNESNLVTCLGTCGWLRTIRGDYAGARTNYDRAAKVSLKRNAPADYAVVLDDLASLELDMGDYESAEDLYSQALAERRKAKLDSSNVLFRANLHNLGLIRERQGKLAEAEKLLTENLESIKAASGGPQERAHTLETLAFLYGRQGRFSDAESYYEQALSAYQQPLANEINPPPFSAEYARTLNNLGFLYARHGNFAKAEPLLLKALELREKLLSKTNPEYADGLEDAAVMYFAKGDIDTAREKLTESLNLTQFHLDVASNVQSEREQLLMAKLLRRRLDLYLSMTDASMAVPVYSRVLTWKGAVFQRQHCMRMARENPELKVTFEQLRQLAQQLSSLVMHPPEGPRLTKWRDDIARLTKQREQLEKKLAPTRGRSWRIRVGGVSEPKSLLSVIPNDAALFDYLNYERTVIDQEAGEGKTAWHTESHYVAFVLTSSRIDRFELGPAAPINETVKLWRDLIGRRGTGNSESDPGKMLRQSIWSPLEATLGTASIVLVSPDSTLNLLPFASLPGKTPKSFVIEDVGIAIVPVPQQLPEIVRANPRRADKPPVDGDIASSSLLVLGGVNFDGQSTLPAASQQIASRAAPNPARGTDARHWQRLEATEGEIATIAKRFRKQFDQSKITELEEEEATKSALCAQAPNHRFLHLATHGFFASSQLTSAVSQARDNLSSDTRRVVGFHPGVLSGLVLAGANHPIDVSRDDGILTALEVAELDLRNVELATLSACETGLGLEAGGEGLLGLQRAFHVAGTRTVVASLWEVNDESTRALMERFYENLWKKRLSRLESLREAQLWMLNEGKSRGLIRKDPTPDADSRTPPLYWAAFVLSGDWR